MNSKFARVAVGAGLAAALTAAPTVALAQSFSPAAPVSSASGVRCLITIDTPWGEFCLVPDLLT